MPTDQRVAKERRSFLKGVAAAGGAAALAGLSRQAVAREEAAKTEVEDSRSSQGYRETSHVKDFYASLRI